MEDALSPTQVRNDARATTIILANIKATCTYLTKSGTLTTAEQTILDVLSAARRRTEKKLAIRIKCFRLLLFTGHGTLTIFTVLFIDRDEVSSRFTVL